MGGGPWWMMVDGGETCDDGRDGDVEADEGDDADGL